MIKNGIYPTMITPYKDGKIDYENVEKLVSFYKESGCNGIFAVCQSSEMNYLSLSERVELAKRVVEFADGKMDVVASGHCAFSLDAQAEEINAIWETGIDAFVLVSNKLDIHNRGDQVFLENMDALLIILPLDVRLGIYECPMPYKRLLTPTILDWCIKSQRFAFIKDTCCDPDLLSSRLDQLSGSSIKLFNANAQTFLHSLRHGAAGYSGIMANYYPALLVWLSNHFDKEPESAEMISDFISMTAFTEGPAYPCTAKYYLGLKGFDMATCSRSCSESNLTSYQRLVMEQLYRVEKQMEILLAT